MWLPNGFVLWKVGRLFTEGSLAASACSSHVKKALPGEQLLLCLSSSSLAPLCLFACCSGRGWQPQSRTHEICVVKPSSSVAEAASQAHIGYTFANCMPDSRGTMLDGRGATRSHRHRDGLSEALV